MPRFDSKKQSRKEVPVQGSRVLQNVVLLAKQPSSSLDESCPASETILISLLTVDVL